MMVKVSECPIGIPQETTVVPVPLAIYEKIMGDIKAMLPIGTWTFNLFIKLEANHPVAPNATWTCTYTVGDGKPPVITSGVQAEK